MGRGEGLSFPEADAPHPDCPPRRPVGHPCERGGWPGDPALRNLATAVRTSLLAPRCGRSSSFLPPCTGRETEAGADRLTGRGADGVCTWALVHVPRVPAAFRAHVAGGPCLHRDTESLASELRRAAVTPHRAPRRSGHDAVPGLSPFGGRHGGGPGRWPHAPACASSRGLSPPRARLVFSFVLCRVPEFLRV